jgi:hypothetical protein
MRPVILSVTVPLALPVHFLILLNSIYSFVPVDSLWSRKKNLPNRREQADKHKGKDKVLEKHELRDLRVIDFPLLPEIDIKTASQYYHDKRKQHGAQRRQPGNKKARDILVASCRPHCDCKKGCYKILAQSIPPGKFLRTNI